MIGSGNEKSRENSERGQGSPTVGTSGPNHEADQARGVVGDSGSSVDLWEMITHKERSGVAGRDALTNSMGQGDGSPRGGLPAPSNEKIRKLQRTLYRKAKSEPKYRFYSLYGEICRMDILAEAFAQVKAKGGSGGVDGVSIREIAKDKATQEEWLRALREDLLSKRYRPNAVRRVKIPKGNGQTRSLGIPTIRDRVVQAATVIVLSAIFEADFHPNSFGFRPKRSAHDAIEKIKEGLYSGRAEVIDADLKSYFDLIPHRQLMKLVAKRVSDGNVLKLIKAWLRAPIEEETQGGRTRKVNKQGTPQGGVISPLLANLYLNDLDHGVNEKTGGLARMIRYADDFVILCPKGKSGAILERVKKWLERREICLNEEKTKVIDSRAMGFNFLGFGITWRRSQKGKAYVHVEPNAKSRKKLQAKLKELLNTQTRSMETDRKIQAVNRVVRGWSNYFQVGQPRRVFWQVQDWLCERVRDWLWEKHKRKCPKFGYSKTRLFEEYGLYRMIDNLEWRG